MGRKIKIKLIKNLTRRQVTFSKRRTSISNKCKELTTLCDVETAFVAFSPAGRASQHSSRGSIRGAIAHYANLPIEQRYSETNDLKGKLEKLYELSRIKNDKDKMHYLNDQIENLELQVRKKKLDVHLFESKLRYFEPDLDGGSSLQQLSWAERRIQEAIDKLKERKKSLNANPPTQVQPSYKQKGKSVMQNGGGSPSSNNVSGNHVHSSGPSSTGNLQINQHDPWTRRQLKFGPASVPQNIFTEVFGKQQEVRATPEENMYNNISNVPMPTPHANAINQFGNEGQFGNGGIATEAQNVQCSYAPVENYQMWNQAPMPWEQQGDSNYNYPSFATFAGESSNMAQNFPEFQPNFTQSVNGFPTNFAETNDSWMMDIVPAETNSNRWMMDFTPAEGSNSNWMMDFTEPHQDKIPYPQNMMFNNDANNIGDNLVQEGYSNNNNGINVGNNNNNNNSYNDGTYEPMIQSPATFDVSSTDLPDAFFSEDYPFEDNALWNQGIQQSWGWYEGGMFFQQNPNGTNDGM